MKVPNRPLFKAQGMLKVIMNKLKAEKESDDTDAISTTAVRSIPRKRDSAEEAMLRFHEEEALLFRPVSSDEEAWSFEDR